MTLVAAFRCQKGGILLCADREESDGLTKRAVDKIYRIMEPLQCEVFIAGAGPGDIIRVANREIHLEFLASVASKEDSLADHPYLIEKPLKAIHAKFSKRLKYDPMNLIVVVAPRAEGHHPILYWTNEADLIPEYFYTAHGSGRTVSNYLADKLYTPYREGKLGKDMMGLLGAFILREAGESVVGVGGADMLFIREGEYERQHIGHERFGEFIAGIPNFADMVHAYWKEHATIPTWLVNP
jgi:20S proteasome alpha/beta subunit